MAVRKKTRSTRPKKKAAVGKKAAAGKQAAKRTPTRKAGREPGEDASLRDIARSFAFRHLR